MLKVSGRKDDGRRRASLRKLLVPVSVLVATLLLGVAAGFAATGGQPGQADRHGHLAEARRAVAELMKKRQTPEARAQRRSSRTAFANLSAKQAISLATRSFHVALASPLWSGPHLQNDEHIDYLGSHAGRITSPGAPPSIVESTAPLIARNESGKKRPVQLILQHHGSDFESANPAVPVTYSEHAARFTDLGVAVHLKGLRNGAAERVEAGRLAVTDALKDTDLWLAPTPLGFRTFAVLRSAASPQSLTFSLDLPVGDKLVKGPGGTAAVERNGKQILAISAPLAADADGVPVPVSMGVKGHTLVLAVPHRSKDLHYPLVVDPEYTYDEWAWYGDETPEYEGWYSHGSSTFDAAPLYLPGRWYGGLYSFTHEGAFVSNGDYMEWRLDPPGATKVYKSEMEINTNGLNGSFEVGISSGQHTWSSGVVSYTNFINCAVETCDPTKGWENSYAFYKISSLTSETRTSSNKLIGSITAARIYYSDNDVPTFASVNSGGSSAWVKSFSGEVTGPVRDYGVGMKALEATISASGWINGGEKGCAGTSQEPCPQEFATNFPVSGSELPDGKHQLNIDGWDALGQKGSDVWGNIWLDREGPNVQSLSGSLWEKSDKPNAEGKATAEAKTLEAGTYTLKIPATDGVSGGSEGEQRSGVKSVEVQVDGETVLAPDSVSCPAGSCPDTREWSFNTAEYPAGTRTITVVAKDQIGNQSSKSFHVIVPPAGELELPVGGTKTSRWVQLKAHADNSTYSTVRFQVRKVGGTWANIPLEALTNSAGEALSSIEQPISGSVSPLVNFEVAKAFSPALTGGITQLQVRGIYGGSGGGGTSKSVPITLDPRGLTSDDARTAVGPGEVNLATGNLNVVAGDASVESWGTSLSVSRAFNSRDPEANAGGPFGPGWTLSAPVEGASEYASLKATTDAYGGEVVELATSGGETILFYLESGKYVPETGYETMSLTKPTAEEFSLKDDGGDIITFKKQSGTTGSIFVPTQVQQPGSANTSSVSYEVAGGVPRIATILAPVPSGVSCSNLNTNGCRSLKLVYATSTTAKGSSESEWGSYTGRIEKVEFTAYDPATAAMKTDVVSQYLYDSAGRLRAQWDPRVSPALKTRYAYDSGGRLAEISPPGMSAWKLSYAALPGDGDGGRLQNVSRGTPQGTATTTVVYGVPLSGSGAPNAMSPSEVAAWGQQDDPVGATAIFPPDTVPSNPPSSYARATIHYLDRTGKEVNTATSGGGIATTEYDAYGNAIRELSPADRKRALEAGSSSAEVAQKLDTDRVFGDKGMEMEEELGPEHEIKLANGEAVRARSRTVIAYDEGAPEGKDPHLPTTTTTEAKVTGGSATADARVSKTEYDWTLLKPTKTVKDYGGLNVTENTTYYSETGLTEGSYKPNNPKPSGSYGSPERTKYYFQAGEYALIPACGKKPQFANLLCREIIAGSNVSTTWFAYNRLDQLTSKKDEVSDRTRTKTISYDAAGRETSSQISASPDQSGLAAAYGFEESTGTTAADSSGNGNTGTLVNLTHTVQGRFGRALEFDSSSDKITVPDSNSLDSGGEITIEAWVRPNGGSGTQQIVSKEGSTGCSSPAYALYASGVSELVPRAYACGSSYGAPSGSKLAVGVWSHVAMTINSSRTIKFYVNGEQIASGTIEKAPGASTGGLTIGSGFLGLMDEVRVYTRALSQQEIHADMTMAVDTQTTPPTYSQRAGLLASYAFEEPEGSTQLVDSSGNGRNGELNSGQRTLGGRQGSAIETTSGMGGLLSAAGKFPVGNGMTFEMWMYPIEEPLVGKGLIEGITLMKLGETFSLRTLQSGLAFKAGNGEAKNTSIPFALNHAHFIAVTYGSGTAKLYVDGVQRASASVTSGTTADAEEFEAEAYFGRTDEIRIYNKALTLAETQEDAATPIRGGVSAPTNGTALPAVTTEYNSSTGLPTKISTLEGIIARSLTTEYDELGRPVSYTDANGNTSTTTYDIDGRTTQAKDGLGTQTFKYDSTTGRLNTLEDSQAGSFSAEYDSTGQLVAETFPNGMVAAYTYDETGTPISLKYTKSGCPTCVWYSQSIKESAQGQWLTNETTVASHSYTYDGAGRLTLVKETPAGKGCTTRSYTYDADSNRLSKITRAPGAEGACVTSGSGEEVKSTYDSNDRITGEGFTYDPFGRLVEIPAANAGGQALSMTYYVNDIARTETQNGQTVGWLLDPMQSRPRATIPSGGKETVYHYSDGSDSPSWTAEMSGESTVGWERPVGGIGGSLGAVVTYNGSTTTTKLQMTNLHGDVVGVASSSSEASAPLELFEADEFGSPIGSTTHTYGWLGAKGKRTTLASGVIQMGVRAYVPAMGRFTTVDPVFGGSANSYDYANQAPLNMFDLDGTRVRGRIDWTGQCVPNFAIYPGSYLRNTPICWLKKPYFIQNVYEIKIAELVGLNNCLATWKTLKFGNQYKNVALMAGLAAWCAKYRWYYVRYR